MLKMWFLFPLNFLRNSDVYERYETWGWSIQWILNRDASRCICLSYCGDTSRFRNLSNISYGFGMARGSLMGCLTYFNGRLRVLYSKSLVPCTRSASVKPRVETWSSSTLSYATCSFSHIFILHALYLWITGDRMSSVPKVGMDLDRTLIGCKPGCSTIDNITRKLKKV